MIDLSAKKSNFISTSIQAAQTILSAYEILVKINKSNQDQGFLTAGSELNLTDADFVGENNHLDRASFQTGLINGLAPIIAQIEANTNVVRKALQRLLRS